MLATLIALATTAFPASTAYPIDPVPLATLCEQADTIVVAHVGEPARIPDTKGFAPSHEVELTTLVQLEGDFTPTLRVRYLGNMVCPAPPRFHAGERVVAFLQTAEDGTYRVVGLSYGTKVLLPEAEKITCDRIAELVRIQGKEDWRTSDAFTEWVVRCAEEPATLGAAIDELTPKVAGWLIPIASPDADEEAEPTPAPLAERLSASQRLRLLAAAASADGAPFVSMKLIEPFLRVRDPRFDELVVAELRDDDIEDARTLGAMMLWLGKRWNDPELGRFATWAGEMGADEDGRRRVLAEFLAYVDGE